MGSQSRSPISVEVIVFDSCKPGIVSPILVVSWSPKTPNIATRHAMFWEDFDVGVSLGLIPVIDDRVRAEGFASA